MLEIWNFTVRCDICIRSAISLYSRPSHTSRRTSISLAVSSELSARPSFTLGVLSGKICSPAIVFSITSISFSGLISLYQKLSAFASLALFKISDTLAKAYSIIEEGGQPLASETTCIQYIFLSPSHIEAFHNNELYLEYIQNLVKERFNVSFPEEKSTFDQYFSDCIQLKEQLESHGNFDKTVWLSYTTSLLESLKTPYYSVYSFTLLTLESCFTDPQLFDKVQKSFYSVLIKSSEKKQSIIRKIIEHAPVYKKYSYIKENLLSDILINTLALFGDEKEYCWHLLLIFLK